ncbi:MAG: RecX family transcriptional regulator [Ruminococcus sp.]|nr:RecX family transcriptional regulator [Ruminococcus sp.]
MGTVKITNISKYKGMTYMVEFEEGEPEFVNIGILNMFNIKAGASLPLSAWEEVKNEDLFRKAKERALYLLDYKDYSYIGLYEKLEKNYSEEICLRVLDKLVEMGAVNDRRYAEGMARHYVEVKHFGRYRAFREMRSKGLTAEVINEALDVYDGDVEESWYDRLKELVENRYLRYLDDEKGINKVKNALVRYGYTYDLIKEVINDVLEEYSEE